MFKLNFIIFISGLVVTNFADAGHSLKCHWDRYITCAQTEKCKDTISEKQRPNNYDGYTYIDLEKKTLKVCVEKSCGKEQPIKIFREVKDVALINIDSVPDEPGMQFYRLNKKTNKLDCMSADYSPGSKDAYYSAWTGSCESW